ncbi:hypothetical protein [Roseovarius sp.]|uniref:hypothetical protein n=1 Tax=Roseovarius sp. TaxID=1486281 RepID=UPI00356480F0
MTNFLVDGPEFTRGAYERALREAEALPDDDPDKEDLVTLRRRLLVTYFDYPRRTADQRRMALRNFLDAPAS